MKRTIVAALLALCASAAQAAHASKVDCDALGRFATLSLTNRLIGVPFQPTAANMFIDAPWTPDRTTASSKSAVFDEAYTARELHVTPNDFGADIRAHCLRGEFLDV